MIDDESDYFSVDANRWLSTQEKAGLRKKEEELREKRHASRRDQVVTLDLAGRKVVEDDKQFGQWVCPNLYNFVLQSPSLVPSCPSLFFRLQELGTLLT